MTLFTLQDFRETQSQEEPGFTETGEGCVYVCVWVGAHVCVYVVNMVRP